MSLRRVGGLAAMALATILWASCGPVYRPVVIPVNTIPPDSSNFHSVFSVNVNTPFNQGTALQIDVSGDTAIGAVNMGVNPTHGAALQNNTRVFVTSAGSLFAGDADTVSASSAAVDSGIASGMGPPFIFSLPSGTLPVFVNSTELATAYVANFGTNSVSALNTLSDVVTLTAPAGINPVVLAETPDGLNLYVANQGDNTVLNLSPLDLTLQATISVGNTPAWMITRPDAQRVYLITIGDGMLYTINTATNTVIGGSPQSLGGPGANFVTYDKSRNRLYATNPNAGAVYVFDATTDPPTPMGSATGALTIPPPPPCAVAGVCGPVTPVGVAALPDSTRFYVASYAIAATCPDPNLIVAGCIIPQVTVFDAGNFYLNGAPVVKSTVFPLLPSSATPVAGVQPYAVAPVAFCVPSVPYSPLFTRFRMSAAAAADSSHVYASICDAGSIADIVTATSSISESGSNSTDFLITDVAAPFSANAAGANGEPPSQNPIYLFTGQ